MKYLFARISSSVVALGLFMLLDTRQVSYRQILTGKMKIAQQMSVSIKCHLLHISLLA